MPKAWLFTAPPRSLILPCEFQNSIRYGGPNLIWGHLFSLQTPTKTNLNNHETTTEFSQMQGDALRRDIPMYVAASETNPGNLIPPRLLSIHRVGAFQV